MKPHIAGIIGVCLTAMLWSVASWRLFHHFFGYCNKADLQFSDDFSPRRLFHVILWFCMGIEAAAYFNMANIFPLSNDENYRCKIGYALLELIGRGIFEYTAFAVVTRIWFRTTAEARAGAAESSVLFRIFPALLILSNVALIAHSIAQVVDLFNPDYPDLESFQQKSFVHRSGLLTEATAWAIHSLLVLVCVMMMFKRIRGLPTFLHVRRRTRQEVIAAMLIPNIVCGACYLLRSLWMVAGYIHVRSHRRSGDFEAGVGWWVGNVWVPMFLTSVILLWSTRKRDRGANFIDGVSDATLLPNPVPAEEVFKSFRHSIFPDEDASIISDNFLQQEADATERMYRHVFESDEDSEKKTAVNL